MKASTFTVPTHTSHTKEKVATYLYFNLHIMGYPYYSSLINPKRSHSDRNTDRCYVLLPR